MRSAPPAIAFGLLLALGPSAAWAEPKDPEPEEEPPEPAFDRPIVKTDVYPAECAEREEGDVEAAKGLHRAAKFYFERERYAEAVDAWTVSHRFDCTAHRLLLNIATVYERLGDVVGAREALAQYLARSPEPYAEGTVEKYEALVDKPVPRRLPDQIPEPGEPIAPPAEVPLGAWISLGVGAATTVVGVAVFTVGAVQTEQSCPDDPPSCTRVERLDAEQGITLQHSGGILMALGVTSMAAAGVWTWAALGAGTDAPPEITVGVGPTSLMLTGRF